MLLRNKIVVSSCEMAQAKTSDRKVLYWSGFAIRSLSWGFLIRKIVANLDHRYIFQKTGLQS